jgi:eukaryotic-like serine/threonine-protein kinase
VNPDFAREHRWIESTAEKGLEFGLGKPGGGVVEPPSDLENRRSGPRDDDHLDSWKEIAGYLQRDVTTVRRWEKQEGLPVHRHLHHKLGSVYAFKTEIDDWWQGRRQEIDSGGSDRERLAWALVAGCVAISIVAAAGLISLRSRMSSEDPELHFSIAPPDDARFGSFEVSPDGRHFAFTASGLDGTHLWVRPRDSITARRLPGTENAEFPFWSPDSRFLGFFAGGKLKKIAVSGGTVQAICDAPQGRGGTWNEENVILFAPGREHGLFRVAAAGGVPTPVTEVQRPRHRGHLWPAFLPDGRHFVYLADSTQTEHHAIYVGTLGTTASKRLLSAQSSVAYSRDGYLIFARGGGLIAQPFDARRRELAGDPIMVAELVLQQYGFDHKGDFSVSKSGVLAYRTSGSVLNRLVWVDRRGEHVGIVGEPAVYAEPVLSPDQKRLAVSVFDADAPADRSDIWLLDLSSGSQSRFTFDRAADFEAAWSPDGARIIFSSNRRRVLDLYQKNSNGSGVDEILVKSDSPKHVETWSPDGRYVVYTSVEAKTKYDLWLLPLFGDRMPTPYLQSEFSEGQSQISPDGRWIAYTSNESGRFEVYVGAFPEPGEMWQISTNGGADPRWRPDGKELFFIAADGQLMALPVEIGSRFEPGAPQALFDTHVRHLWEDARNHYDVSRDGTRFVVTMPVETPRSLPFTIVVNWASALRR